MKNKLTFATELTVDFRNKNGKEQNRSLFCYSIQKIAWSYQCSNIGMHRGHSKSTFVQGSGRGRHWKVNKSKQGEGGPRIFVCLIQKKMLRFSNWSVIVILQFFSLIIIAVWNIKQTIMKDYNVQSWLLRQP